MQLLACPGIFGFWFSVGLPGTPHDSCKTLRTTTPPLLRHWLALQASRAVHLGVDNLIVVRHVGRVLGGTHAIRSLELENDGELIGLIQRMIRFRGEGAVRITKVKGQAEEDLVRRGQIRELDREGNNRAGEAADFGRRWFAPHTIYARRNLSGVCERWYPVVRDLHRFLIAVSRAVVNDDGAAGIAPHPLVWSAGSLPEKRRVVHAIRDAALLPGPPPIGGSGWVENIPASVATEDVCQWPYSLGVLVKLVAFLSTLHWPDSGVDFGVVEVPFIELLILHELSVGERLVLEKAVPRNQRPGRPISVSALPFGPGIDIWRSCRVSWWCDQGLGHVAWRVGPVYALQYWCKSLPSQVHRLGKVWT